MSKLGPGFLTGVSDDDPSGIATYSQAGAQFGSSMLWTTLFTYPLMTSIQEISARIGRVTGRGIAGNIRKFYPVALLHFIVVLLFISSMLNLGADIGAMAAAMELLVGKHDLHIFAVVFGLVSLIAQVFIPYRPYVRALKWVSLSVFTYVGVVLAVDIPWRQVLHDTVVPSLSWDRGYLMALAAILGTTISPYLFFWQSSQEVEEQQAAPGEEPLKRAPEQATAQFERIRADTYLGMAISNAIAFFIMLTAAVTLHTHGKTDIQTAAQAAEALKPIAGNFAFALFSLGIIGTGLLAVPVLAGSAGYAVGEALKWRTGLDRKPPKAKGFYAVIVIATVLGTALNFSSIDPIKALFWSAIINGVVAVPILIVMMSMATSKKVMGTFVIPRTLVVLGWTTSLVMGVAAVAMFVSLDR